MGPEAEGGADPREGFAAPLVLLPFDRGVAWGDARRGVLLADLAGEECLLATEEFLLEITEEALLFGVLDRVLGIYLGMRNVGTSNCEILET